jgi:ferritin
MLEFIHFLNYSGAKPSILATEKPQTNFDPPDSFFQACKKASRQLDDSLTI